MSNLPEVQEIAERLRQEPYHLLTNDCIIKSLRLKKQCKRLGVPARVVVCLGLGQAKLFGRRVTVLIIHAWTEVAGKRVETSRPLGAAGICGIVPMNIKPVVAVWI